MVSKVTIHAAVISVVTMLFVPHLAEAAEGPWRFVVTCDTRGYTNGINEKIAGEIAAEVVRQNAEFMLFPGDLVSGYTAGSPAGFESQLRLWVKVMKPLYDAGIGVYVCRGNHEISDAWGLESPPDANDNYATRWLDVFGNDTYPKQKLPDNGPPGEKHMTYFVTHKNAFIVALDQYAGTQHHAIHRINQRWLDAQLAANTQPHIFVFGHEPAFRVLHTDCLDNYPAERDAFWASLRNAGGRTYFCGHDHFYLHTCIDDGDSDPDNDIHQFSVATAGAPPYTWQPPYTGDNSYYTPEQWYYLESFGYILVEIDNLQVTLTYMARGTRDVAVLGVYLPTNIWTYSVVPRPIVLSPNGGEKLLANTAQTITWKTIQGAEINEVSVECSLDGGAAWQLIGKLPNTGSCLWQTLAVDSNQCLIRISDVSDQAKSDTSDRLFTIFKCQAKLKADLNNDCYVNHLDFLIISDEWLQCGNPFDPACPHP